MNSSTSDEPVNGSNCIQVGGVIIQGGGCQCPPGLTSSYDAFITHVFCSVQTEYSPNDPWNISNNGSLPISGSTAVDSQTVSVSGVVQLAISFALSMILVWIIRCASSCCRQQEQQQYANQWTGYVPHSNSCSRSSFYAFFPSVVVY